MNNITHSLWVAFIAIVVAIIGGVIQGLTNFHPTDQITSFIMSSIGGLAIGGLNMLLHKIQGTTVETKTP